MQPGQAVCPGDVLATLQEDAVVHIGPGIQPLDDALVAVCAGTLCTTTQGTLWIDTPRRRYVPARSDPVIGIITERYADTYHVHINATFAAQLPVLAFDGATRRNRPNLNVGDVVYAWVESCHRDLETMLSCINPHAKKTGFGPLAGGHIVWVDTAHARQLLVQPPATVLASLGASLQYEVAVGLNGGVWVSAPSPGVAVLVTHALRESRHMSDAQCASMVEGLLKRVQGGRQR